MRAYQEALKAPGMSEKARTANLLGNVERDMGNYQNARCYYQDALEAWQKNGDAECIAGANNNLGILEMSLGNFAAAGRYHSDTLKRNQEAARTLIFKSKALLQAGGMRHRQPCDQCGCRARHAKNRD